jgi:hypothetical protein
MTAELDLAKSVKKTRPMWRIRTVEDTWQRATYAIQKRFLWFFWVNRQTGHHDLQDAIKALKLLRENDESLNKVVYEE